MMKKRTADFLKVLAVLAVVLVFVPDPTDIPTVGLPVINIGTAAIAGYFGWKKQ